MKKALTLVVVAVLSFGLGAGCVYVVMRAHVQPKAEEWIFVESNGEGFMYTLDTVGAGIPFPKTHKPTGRIKFLSRDKGIQIGYIIQFPIDPDPTSKFPAKYLKKVKLDSGEELGPPDQLQLHGHFEFTLKDADGFALMSLTGPGEYLAAASQNERQATADESVPASIVQRTRKVDVTLSMDDCTPCHPQ